MSVLLPLVLVLAVLAFLAYRGFAPKPGYMPPPPSVLRTDLWFGYFHTFDDQVAQTSDHVNIIFESGWFGAEATALSIRVHGKQTILCLSNECYDYAEGAMVARPDAYDRVTATFNKLASEGVLSKVVALYPIDEPDVSGKSDADILSLCLMVRSAAAHFPALDGVKLAVIYANKGTLPGISGFEWVGLDDYPLREGLLDSDEWSLMLSRLDADQRVMLVPGGADPFRQDPEAFRRYAHNNPKVIGILAYMWAQQYPGELAGIGTNGMADKYRSVGRELTKGQT